MEQRLNQTFLKMHVNINNVHVEDLNRMHFSLVIKNGLEQQGLSCNVNYGMLKNNNYYYPRSGILLQPITVDQNHNEFIQNLIKNGGAFGYEVIGHENGCFIRCDNWQENNIYDLIKYVLPQFNAKPLYDNNQYNIENQATNQSTNPYQSTASLTPNNAPSAPSFSQISESNVNTYPPINVPYPKHSTTSPQKFNGYPPTDHAYLECYLPQSEPFSSSTNSSFSLMQNYYTNPSEPLYPEVEPFGQNNYSQKTTDYFNTHGNPTNTNMYASFSQQREEPSYPIQPLLRSSNNTQKPQNNSSSSQSQYLKVYSMQQEGNSSFLEKIGASSMSVREWNGQKYVYLAFQGADALTNFKNNYSNISKGQAGNIYWKEIAEKGELSFNFNNYNVLYQEVTGTRDKKFSYLTPFQRAYVAQFFIDAANAIVKTEQSGVKIAFWKQNNLSKDTQQKVDILQAVATEIINTSPEKNIRELIQIHLDSNREYLKTWFGKDPSIQVFEDALKLFNNNDKLIDDLMPRGSYRH